MKESFLLYLLLLSVSTLFSFIMFFYFYIKLELNQYKKARFISVLLTTELSFLFLCLISSNPFLLIGGNLIVFLLFFAVFYDCFHQSNFHILLRNFIFDITLSVIFFCIYTVLFFQISNFYYKSTTIILLIVFERFLVPILFFSLLIWKKQSIHLLPKISLLTIIPPIFHTIICLIVCYLWNNTTKNNLLLLFFICLICIICSIFDLILFAFFSTTIVNQELSLQIDITKQQLKRNQNYYASVQEHLTETQNLKTEFYQKLHCVYQTVHGKKAGSKEQALHLLDALNTRINQTSSIYFCKNPIINTILGEYSQKAKLHQVQLDVDIRDTDTIFLEPNELYTIFSFLLSDAMEEVCQLEVCRYIEIFIYQKANFFIIKENHSKFNTDKQFEQSRSYHQLILNRLVKKYGGNLQIQSNDSYTTILMFPFPE